LISVEKRTRPNCVSKAGVTVPWIIACTAIGRTGVGVIGLVAVIVGEGVSTTSVAVADGGTGVSVGGPAGMGDAVSDGAIVGRGDAAGVGATVAVGGRAAGLAAGRQS
jgi:hypothetical protein